MNKVITIHLHGRAYQLEEPGYDKLQQYLADAAKRLEQDPDKQEILADLEQAIGEKFDRFLNPNKTVVVEKEVAEVLSEMGPVQSSAAAEQAEPNRKSDAAGTPKRLYQISEGAMFSGVCMGLAAYFNVDVALVRVVFVILTVLTHGAWLLVYFIMMLVLPHATTSAQMAAAYGQPFTAQELVNRARQEYQKFADKGEWKKWKYEMKQKMRQEKWERRRQRYQAGNYGSPFATPLLGILTGVLAVLWVVGLVSLIKSGVVFGLAVPASIPLWAALLIWLCLYGFVMWPLKAARWATHFQPGSDRHIHHYHDGGFFEAVIWLAFIILVVWAVWTYVPAAHPFLQKIQLWAQHVWANLSRR